MVRSLRECVVVGTESRHRKGPRKVFVLLSDLRQQLTASRCGLHVAGKKSGSKLLWDCDRMYLFTVFLLMVQDKRVPQLFKSRNCVYIFEMFWILFFVFFVLFFSFRLSRPPSRLFWAPNLCLELPAS